jgi:hypothetical protein
MAKLLLFLECSAIKAILRILNYNTNYQIKGKINLS